MKFSEYLIKPASSGCNLRCEYCFYMDVSAKRCVSSHGLMSLETLECTVKKAFEETEELVRFGFQGGEPLLAGLGFYQALLAFEMQHNVKHIPVMHVIQTNGTLITPEFAQFFKAHDFLVGVSLDGIKATHDKYRVTPSGQGTFDSILQGIALLEQYEVEYNIITVLGKDIAAHCKEIYAFYKENNFYYLQFIKMLDPDFVQSGTRRYSLTDAEYLRFLNELFDLWYADAMVGNYVSIQYFDEILNKIFGNEQALGCFQCGSCSCQNVIEANGDCYPCDFYCTDDYLLGNIHTHSIASMMQSDATKAFLQEGVAVPTKCKQCAYYRLCRNGCKRYRVDGLYCYCEATKAFLAKNIAKFEQIARRMAAEGNR